MRLSHRLIKLKKINSELLTGSAVNKTGRRRKTGLKKDRAMRYTAVARQTVVRFEFGAASTNTSRSAAVVTVLGV